jgi:hypothetical protein
MDSLNSGQHRKCLLEGARRSNRAKELAMKITTIGNDLTKTTLNLHAVDAHGKTVMHRAF